MKFYNTNNIHEPECDRPPLESAEFRPFLSAALPQPRHVKKFPRPISNAVSAGNFLVSGRVYTPAWR
jgi:hypothetical protein